MHLRSRNNPPLKEVSADWRTEDVVGFTRSETPQHPSDLTQAFDRSPFEGMTRSIVQIYMIAILNQKTFVHSVVKTISRH